MNILVSACLLGVSCRYDGDSKPREAVLALMEKHTLIPVCGEIFGGLPTPRHPSERRDGGVYMVTGENVTAQYERGANEVLRLARLYDCRVAVLKERSPSCGSGRIYDGTFTNTLTDGWGVTAEKLRDNGMKIYGESEIDALIADLEEEKYDK